MTHKRKICVVTSTRADYGLLYWLMKQLSEDNEVHFQLIVTGTHLSPEFGMTLSQIEEDGFQPDAKVEMLLSSDSAVGMTKSLGLAVVGFADALAQLHPDLLVILGDRYEILAAAQAALMARIPVAHIHGGELTEGAMDDAIRHSITKMASLHFVAAEPYRKRVIQLGEQPQYVFNFGAPGLEHIRKLQPLSKAELEAALDFRLGDITFLVTFHPATLSNRTEEVSMQALFNALEAYPTAQIIITKPNADAGGRIISRMIDDYAGRNPHRIAVFTSLGRERYVSAVAHASVVIGNSSSGLIEVPFLKKPTVNIGSRQNGRLRAASVLDCEDETEAIVAAIDRALSPEFQAVVLQSESPYGHGEAAGRMIEVMKSIPLDALQTKTFYDLASDT